MLTILADVAFFGWPLAKILITIIIIAGCVAVTYIVLQVMEITIPGWLIKIFWVCVAVFVGILAIKFLLSL